MSRAKAQAILTDHFGPFGPLIFPYVQMGKIDSLHLFGLETELPIFALYWHNRTRWSRAADIGANLGLHSILMANLGWQVKAFEPDPHHFARLVGNLRANGANTVDPVNAAVHTSDGEVEFVRVLNNLTGNHIAGYKASYGPLETITVRTVDCRRIWDKTDFAKIDCEGNEAELALTMTDADMQHLSCVMEVRNDQNAMMIYRHFAALGVPIWSQKVDWKRVEKLDDMPKLNREGSIFVGHAPPWE